MPSKPADFPQLVAEALERCAADARSTGLRGHDLHTFCEAALLSMFQAAWPSVAKWIAEEANLPPSNPRKILRLTAEAAARKAIDPSNPAQGFFGIGKSGVR